ncbi:uncharacterized protein LOC115224456 [Octopus sinensis]|uniref:Uncharacterized protein LOC115224456 n=1 Tax=Octopus sinensis TaxID=2607531 RepID=A0A6P7TMJ7_9MOLL|nr:uncharacterized protein LOC115224456 [Octopus sinensis]
MVHSANVSQGGSDAPASGSGSSNNSNTELACAYIDFLILGVMFILYSLWWTVQTTRIFFFMRWKHVEFHSSLVYPCSKQRWKQLIQSFIEICLIICGLLLVTNYRHVPGINWVGGGAGAGAELNDAKNSMLKLRSCIILVAFGLSCLVNIGSQTCTYSLPQGLDYCIFIFAFGVEAILFGHYVMDDERDDSLASIGENLVTYCAIMTVVVTILEFHYRNQVVFPFVRSFVTLVQGTWLCHYGTIICSPYKWDITDYNISILSTYFAAHGMANFIVIFIIWLITYKLALTDRCCCLPVSLEKTNEVFLENRVHFNYHMLDRLGSDAE